MEQKTIISTRNVAIRKVYEDIIHAQQSVGYISRRVIISIIETNAAPRFYITPFTARLYINNHRKVRGMRKRDMIKDLIENYHRLRIENPDAPKEWLYEAVVEQPAKSFYMSARRIEEVIFNYSKRNGK